MDFHVLKIGPFLKGEIVQIPRWIANVLGQHGLVALKDPGELDIAQVMKAFWKEKDNPTLQEIDPYFYTKIQAGYYITMVMALLRVLVLVPELVELLLLIFLDPGRGWMIQYLKREALENGTFILYHQCLFLKITEPM